MPDENNENTPHREVDEKRFTVDRNRIAAFKASLTEAAEIVRSWPEWKQTALGGEPLASPPIPMSTGGTAR